MFRELGSKSETNPSKNFPIFFQELQYQLLFTGSIGDFLKGNREALSFHVVCLGLHLGGAGLFHSSSHTVGGHFGG